MNGMTGTEGLKVAKGDGVGANKYGQGGCRYICETVDRTFVIFFRLIKTWAKQRDARRCMRQVDLPRVHIPDKLDWSYWGEMRAASRADWRHVSDCGLSEGCGD